MKKSIVMIMLAMILFSSCNNNKQYEQNISNYKEMSTRLYAACVIQLSNISIPPYNEIEYNLQDARIDSVKMQLDDIYKRLTPPTDKFAETYPHIKESYKQINRMRATLGSLKSNRDMFELYMQYFNEFSVAQKAYVEAFEELQLQTPNIGPKP